MALFNKKSVSERRRKGPVRESVEWFAIALGIALAIKFTIVDVFRIPTGSMGPTLLGFHKEAQCPNCRYTFDVNTRENGDGIYPAEVECPNCRYPGIQTSTAVFSDGDVKMINFRWPDSIWLRGRRPDTGEIIEGADAANRIVRGGNRIIASRLSYKLGKPQRWDAIVFRYPVIDRLTCKSCGQQFGPIHESEGLICPRCKSTRLKWKTPTNFIKRLIATPGETLQVVDGDIYINGKIARKPQEHQDAMWMHVYDSRFAPEKEVVPTWINMGAGWKEVTPKKLVLDALGSEGTRFARFGRDITDTYGYNFGVEGRYCVGDMRIRCKTQIAEGNGPIVMLIERGSAVFQAEWAGGEAVLRRNGAEIARAKAPRAGAEAVELEFAHADKRLWFIVGGQSVIDYSYEDDVPARPYVLDGASFSIGARDLRATFTDFRIQRDVYYLIGRGGLDKLGGPGDPIHVPEKCYVGFGDNSPNSNDSRAWGYVPEKNLLGRAFFSFWPLHTVHTIR